jgi:hypothetical protein
MIDDPDEIVNLSLSGATNATIGQATATVKIDESTTYIYLPSLQTVTYPDLVVTLQLSPTKSSYSRSEDVLFTVTVTNNSRLAAKESFWVDLYINPTTVPTGPNISWYDVSVYGISWYVEGGLQPGASKTLTSTAGSMYPGLSNWNGTFKEAGTKNIYVYVDSYKPGSTTGAVLEQNEANNRAQITGIIVQ